MTTPAPSFPPPPANRNQQPQQQVVVMNVNNANQPTTPSEWQAGLCGCCSDIGATCDSCWCFICMIGHQNKLGSEGMDMTSCCLTFCFPICAGLFVCQARKAVRARLNIVGDSCDCCDCPISCLCPICALVQHKQTMAYYGRWYGSCCTDAVLNGPGGSAAPVAQVMGVMPAPAKQQGL